MSGFSPVRQDLSGKFGCPVLSGQESHMPSLVEPQSKPTWNSLKQFGLVQNHFGPISRPGMRAEKNNFFTQRSFWDPNSNLFDALVQNNHKSKIQNLIIRINVLHQDYWFEFGLSILHFGQAWDSIFKIFDRCLKKFIDCLL